MLFRSKAFKKIELEPDAEIDVVLKLDQRTFAYYDVVTKDWEVESGKYEIRVGFSSRNITQAAHIEVEGTKTPVLSEEMIDVQRDYKSLIHGKLEVEDALFEKLLGRSIRRSEENVFDLNTPISEMRRTLIGKILYHVVAKETRKMGEKQSNAGMKKMIESVVSEITLRNMAMMSGGAVTFKMADAFLEMAKGHYIKGIKHMMKRTQ